MHSPPRRAGRYSAIASWYRHSPARRMQCAVAFMWFPSALVGPPTGAGELAVDLRPRLRRTAGGKRVQHLAQNFPWSDLIGVFQISTIGAFTQAPRHSILPS